METDNNAWFIRTYVFSFLEILIKELYDLGRSSFLDYMYKHISMV